MKKFLLFSLTALMAVLAAHADVTINATNFPDANFRAYLLSEYPSGTITSAQLFNRFGLDLSNKNISNAKGIEYFTELMRLDLNSNNLTSIDVSYNTKLTYLNVSYNRLTSIDVSHNTNLKELYLQSNKFTQLSISELTSLQTLWVQNNQNMTSLRCTYNALTSLNVTGCIKLEELYCYSNKLKTLDLSGCSKLKIFSCETNELTTLDLSSCPQLEAFYCGGNQFATLDVNDLSQLQYLYCNDNQLTTLDVDDLSQLQVLYCCNNQLKTINANGCTNLRRIYCQFNQIKPEGVDALLACLPERSQVDRGAIVFLDSVQGDGNICTNTQVLKGDEKGWTIYIYDYTDDNGTNWYKIYFSEELVCWDDTVAPGATFTMPIYNLYSDWVENTYENLSAAQFDIYLPDGFTLVKVEKGSACTAGALLNYSMSDSYNDGRRYRSVLLNSPNTEYNESEPLLVVTLRAPNCNSKALISLENMIVVGSTNLVHRRFNSYAMITVGTGVTRGDVNGDGNVNTADVSALINLLLTGGTPSGGADANQDGNVNTSDVAALIGYLLSGTW